MHPVASGSRFLIEWRENGKRLHASAGDNPSEAIEAQQRNVQKARVIGLFGIKSRKIRDPLLKEKSATRSRRIRDLA